MKKYKRNIKNYFFKTYYTVDYKKHGFYVFIPNLMCNITPYKEINNIKHSISNKGYYNMDKKYSHWKEYNKNFFYHL